MEGQRGEKLLCVQLKALSCSLCVQNKLLNEYNVMTNDGAPPSNTISTPVELNFSTSAMFFESSSGDD